MDMPNERPNKMWSGRFREPLNRTFEQWQRSFPFAWRQSSHGLKSCKAAPLAMALIGLFSLSAPAARAQAATLTFYTHGSTLTTGLPGSRHGVFYGGIFESKRMLFVFRDGAFAKNNRFFSIELPHGDYTLAASFTAKIKDTDQLPVHLESGKHYFFRAQTRSDGFGIVEWDKGILQQVSCPTALQEMNNAKALKTENIRLADGVTAAPTQSSAPICHSDDPTPTPSAKN